MQFHKYWSPPDTASIQKFLDVRDRLGLPIYMGEGGENNVEWIYTAFRLYESHEIGWNLWPWKKIETLTSPLSVVAPVGWADVRAAASRESVPTRAQAQEVFNILIDSLAPSRCVPRRDVLAAVFAESPRIIPAWGFGFRGRGTSYETRDAVPHPNIRPGDAVSIRFVEPGDNPENPFEQHSGRGYLANELLCVHLEPGEWLEYEVAADPGPYLPIGPTSEVPGVDIVRSDRGFRAIARASVDLVSFILSPPPGDVH